MGLVRTGRWFGMVVLLGAVVLAAPTAAHAAAGDVRLSATINDRDISKVNANRPLKLAPDKPTLIRLEVSNSGNRPLFVRSVRLDAKVMSLTFFSYETRVDLRVAPNGKGERVFTLDLIDLGDQATGLLPSRLALLDANRNTIQSESFPVDVRGSLRSTYGIFGLIVGIITGLLLATAIAGLASHRLSASRWRRAVRFGVPGLGLGLTLTFTLSALRILTPSALRWFALVLISGVALFIVGYLTPTPETPEDYEDDDDDFGYGGSIGEAPAGDSVLMRAVEAEADAEAPSMSGASSRGPDTLIRRGPLPPPPPPPPP